MRIGIYAGQYYDDETGLHYNWHRYYDPSKGRYLTPDPIGFVGGINLYTYVLNNPINNYDFLGLAEAYPTNWYLKGFWMSISETAIGQGFAALELIKKYGATIKNASEECDVDSTFIKAIIYEEYSHQNPPYVEDKVGGDTIGIGQFSPETWKAYGEGSLENREDPIKSIYAMWKLWGRATVMYW